MITDEIFQQLKALDEALTESEFSRRYLCTSRNYLYNRRNQEKDISNDVLLKLYSRLASTGAAWRENAESAPNSRTRDRWRRTAGIYTSLADRVVRLLLDRAVSSR